MPFLHTWSLSVEEQFYLVWPVLLIGLLTVCRARRRRAVRLVALLAVVSAAAMALTWSLEPDPTGAYMFTYSHAFGLLLGAALALSQQPNLLRTWRPHFRPISPVGLSVAAAAALGFLAVAAAGMEWSSRAPYVGGLFLVSAASVVVVLASSNETPFARTLDARWLRWVGRRSYGIYLWHWPLIVLALRLAPPDRSAPAAWTAVGLSVVAAALSYRFVETPIRRNGFRASLARWFGSGVGRPAPAAYRRPVLLIVAASLVVMAAGAVLTAPRTGRLASTLAQGQAAVARSQQPVGPAGGGPALGRPAGSDVLHGSATRTPSWMSPGHPSLAGTARGLVPCREVRNGSAVSAFGDSVLVASSPELLDSMPKMRITAEVGWQYDRVARAVNTALARGTLRPVVVIASGTNGPLEVGAVRHLLHELQPGRRVVLVTPYVPRSWGPTSVRTVDAVAARSPRVAVADWHSAIAARPDLLDPDHVHPGPAAGRIYTDTLQRALAATCSG